MTAVIWTIFAIRFATLMTNINIHLGMKTLNPFSFPRGGVQPRRRENRPTSVTRKFDTLGNGAKRKKLVAQGMKEK